MESKEKDTEREFKQLSPLDHVKLRPNMYIGSISLQKNLMYININENNIEKFELQNIEFSPGLLKIFDEILVNAIDHYITYPKLVSCIEINFTLETGEISIKNTGPGISVVMVKNLKGEEIYKPQAIFSEFLSGDNFSDNTDKTVGGMNGLGSKCVSADTIMPLFSGLLKKAIDITINDVLIGDDGNPRKIFKIIKEYGPMYQVTQTLGESYKVSSEHILTLHLQEHKNICWSNGFWLMIYWDMATRMVTCKATNPASGSVLDIKNKRILSAYYKMQEFADTINDNNIIDISVQEYLNLPQVHKDRFTGIRGSCINWEFKQNYLDPYVLGLWLGSPATEYTPIHKILQKLNLIDNKHIPKEYMINNKETRLNILAGFIDACEFTVKGNCITITKDDEHEKLINDISYLCKSLGFCCVITMEPYNFQDKASRICISGQICDIPTMLSEKILLTGTASSKSTGKINITQINDSIYVGFTVDNNQRILINDFTVTHNCTNAFSTSFNVKTYDGKRDLFYQQTFTDGMQNIESPVINKLEDFEDTYIEPFTEITFMPDYKALGYAEYNETIGKTIEKIFWARTYQTAFFVNKQCVISFNEYAVEFEDGIDRFTQALEMFIPNDYGLYTTTLVHPNKQLNMQVGLGISDGKFMHSSVINGISVYEGGTHIKYISDEIIKNIKPKVEQILAKTKSKFNPNFILNNLFILVICSVTSPEFNSQSKERLTSPIEKFEPYKFKEKEWKKIWELLEPHVTESILGKLKDKTKTRVTRGKIFLTKGNDAKFAGDKKLAAKTTLLIGEGDSALGLLESGINHKSTELDRDYYGTWSIQGVCPNARKEVTVITDKKNGKIIRIRNDKLRDNKRFEELVRLIGLDYGKTYDITTTDGNEEFKTLRYGRVVVATDADTDGKGMIFGLIMNFFTVFWPELVARGFLKRFNTPIIRAYPHNAKELVKEFYALHNYETWVNEKFQGDNELAGSKYDIKYYKGLAGNSANEIKPLFNNFETKLNTYEYDMAAADNLEVYFGKDTAPRKEALSTPVSLEEIAFCDNTLNVPVSQFLKTDVKEFQRDNIIRKLPHVMDGMVPSRRKTFFGARLNKKMATTAIKVVNFTGEVISKTGYTHGDASLSGTIIKMAQSFVGARNLPLLIGVGLFGSRREGGNDTGSPRYVSIKINKSLSAAMFPAQDDFLLRYMFEDGARVEPEYYVPILPLAALESMQIPATGWRVKIWARDFHSVLKNVRNLISGKITKCHKLGIWLRGNNCTVRIAADNKEYLVGKYTYNETTNIISITDLPLSVYNSRFIKSVAFNKDNTLIKELKNVQDYSNYDETTNIDQVDIQFELAAGAMDIIKEKYASALKAGRSIMPAVVNDPSNNAVHEPEQAHESEQEHYIVDALFDPVEEFFKLRLCIDSDINVIDQKGDVREISYYGSIVNIWFKERKKLYKDRIERYIVLSQLMIKYFENIIRFAEERDTLAITNKTIEEKFNSILLVNKYDKFNRGLLMNPKYCKVSDLEANILNSESASYDYIISLTYKSLLKESCVERVKDLNAEKNKLQTLLNDCVEVPTATLFTGQKAWLSELEILEKIINAGVKDGWDAKKTQPKFE